MSTKAWIISMRPVGHCDCRVVYAATSFEATHGAAGIADEAESPYFVQAEEGEFYDGCCSHCTQRGQVSND